MGRATARCKRDGTESFPRTCIVCTYSRSECCCRFVGRKEGRKEGTDRQLPAKIGEAAGDDVVLLLPQQSEQRVESIEYNSVIHA